MKVLPSTSVPIAPEFQQGRRFVYVAIGLFLLTMFAYFPAVTNEFVDWDDHGYITENPLVSGGLTWDGIIYAWTTFDVGNWIPLTWMSYQLDATLFGVNPAAFHAVNVLLHACNVVLLFAVLSRLTGATWRSGTVAALFAVHPLHVESVAWVSERKDLLSTCALLYVLLLYERYARRPDGKRMTLVCIAYGLGLLCKSMLVTVPILLVLLDYWPLRRWQHPLNANGVSENGFRYTSRSTGQLIHEKIPLLFLSAATAVIAVTAQWGPAVVSMHSATLPDRIMGGFDAVRWYLLTTICPLNLSAFYPHPGTVDPDWLHDAWPRTLCSAALVIAITLFVLWRRRQPQVFGWLWFLISLLPIIGIVQVGSQAYADRYTYIPHVGLFVLLVWELFSVLPARSAGTWIAASILSISLLVCTGLTHLQIQTWRTSESLWTNAIRVDPQNLFAHLKLGIELSRQRRFSEAKHHLSEALLLFPNFEQAIMYLGILNAADGNELESRAYFEWLLRVNPKHPVAHQSLAYLYQQHPPVAHSPLSDEVIFELNQGVAKGARITRMTDWAAGLEHFERAIVLNPTCAPALRFAGDALEEMGRFNEAKQKFEAALRLDPMDVEALHGKKRVQRRSAGANEQ